MEQGHRLDVAGEDEVVDAYLLQFWPAPAGPGRIVRQTTEIAAYWHRANPEPALTDADRAERKRHKAEKKARRKLEARRGGPAAVGRSSASAPAAGVRTDRHRIRVRSTSPTAEPPRRSLTLRYAPCITDP